MNVIELIIGNIPIVSEIAEALLTPLIAIMTIHIVVQQHKLEKQNYKYQLYPHRIKIYEETVLFIDSVIDEALCNKEDIQSFSRGTAGAMIFFGEDVVDYLNELKDEYRKTWRYQREGQRPPKGDDNNEISKKEAAMLDYFDKQVKICEKKFLPYFDFSKK